MSEVEKIARILCRQAGHDPDGAAKCGFGWLNFEKDAAEILAALQSSRPVGGEAEPVAWQRRYQFALASDPPGKQYQWENCSHREANGHFERQPGYEYRALYSHPATSPVSADVVEAGTREADDVYRGFQSAVTAIRSWAAGFSNKEAHHRLRAVAQDLEDIGG